MRISHVAATLASLSCAILTTSCLQSPTATVEADDTASPSIEQDGTEPIGEAQEKQAWVTPARYGSATFPFVVVVKDDGKDPGGGWQEAHAALSFSVVKGLFVAYRWKCPLVVGMALRSAKEGRISASRAALVTAEIASEAVNAEGATRDDWEGQGAAFCVELYDRMRNMFHDEPYDGYGARVNGR